MDLADGHVAALEKLEQEHLKIKMFNLGTGQGISVLQLINTFESVNGVKVPYEIQARRQGDISAMFANPYVPSLFVWKIRTYCFSFFRF